MLEYTLTDCPILQDHFIAQGFSLDDSNNAGSTPLIEAAYRSKTDAIAWLVAQGQDANAADNAWRNATAASNDP